MAVDTRFIDGDAADDSSAIPAVAPPDLGPLLAGPGSYPGKPGTPTTPAPGILGTSFKSISSKDNGDGATWDPGHDLALGSRNVIEGVTGMPASVLDLATWPGRAAERAFGMNVTAPSDMVSSALDASGLPTAQTDAEKRNATIIRGSAAMLTPLAAGSAAARAGVELPSIVQKLAPAVSGPAAAGQMIAGGAGAELGDITGSAPWVPDALKPTAALLGNVAGAGVTGSLFGALGTLKNAITGVPSDIAAALDRLGIKPGTVGAVTSSPAAQQTEAAFSKAPVAASFIKPAQQQTIDDFGKAVENTASKLGDATNADEAGKAAQDALRDWKENVFPAQQDKIWGNLTKVMTGQPVNPDGYRTALSRLALDPTLAQLPATQQAFVQSTIKTWLDALNADVPPGQTMTWEQAMALKRKIGDQMGSPDIVSSIGNQGLQRVYGGLAGDLQDAAANAGHARMFNTANASTIAGHQFIDGTLSQAIQKSNAGQETISPGEAARNLTGDSSAMQQLRTTVPDAADALAAWKLRSMAQARPSQQMGPGGPAPSTGTFLTNYWQSRLAKPGGHAAMFDDNPDVSQNVSDLATAAAQLRGTEKSLNTSGTAGASDWLRLGPEVAAAWYLGGPKAAAAAAAGHFAVPAAVGYGLASPLAIGVASAQRGGRLPYQGLLGGALSDITQPPPSQ